MNTPGPILFWTAFEPKPDGHGGNLRSLQLSELCREAGFRAEPVQRALAVSAPVRFARGFQAAIALRRAGVRLGIRSWSLAGFYSSVVRRAREAHPSALVLVWEDTTAFVVPWVARQLGLATIAAPQNIESLARNPVNLGLLRSEVAALALADHVFCIAEEESWLLANCGVKADFLPYFPPEVRRERLARIASRRGARGTPGGPWLVVGTAHNQPTRQGMESLLQGLQSALGPRLRVIVAGFGTEALRGKVASDFVDIRGTVGDEELDTLMTEARGLIVHQDRGAGALTRIPEALLAGLPVVANRVAARGTRGCVGVHVYDTFSELASLLPSLNPGEVPGVPASAAAGRFQALLRVAHRNG